MKREKSKEKEKYEANAESIATTNIMKLLESHQQPFIHSPSTSSFIASQTLSTTQTPTPTPTPITTHNYYYDYNNRNKNIFLNYDNITTSSVHCNYFNKLFSN